MAIMSGEAFNPRRIFNSAASAGLRAGKREKMTKGRGKGLIKKKHNKVGGKSETPMGESHF